MSAFGGVSKLFSDDFAFKEAFLYVVQKCMCKYKMFMQLATTSMFKKIV